MILWSFWVDSWEHPFNTWSSNASLKAFVEPAPTIRDYLPPLKLPPTPPAAVIPVAEPKRESSTSWDWSKFRIPLFQNGFTRDRLPQPKPSPRRDYRGEWGMPLAIYPFQPYPIGWLIPHVLYMADMATEGTEYDYDQPQ